MFYLISNHTCHLVYTRWFFVVNISKIKNIYIDGVLVVVAIIGILSVVVVPHLLNNINRSKITEFKNL